MKQMLNFALDCSVTVTFAFVFTRCNRSFYLLADLLLPPSEENLVSKQQENSLTKKKKNVVNGQGHYI